MTNMEPIVAAETRLFSAGAPAQEPKEPESRDIFSISEDEAVVKNAVSKVISENKKRIQSAREKQPHLRQFPPLPGKAAKSSLSR